MDHSYRPSKNSQHKFRGRALRSDTAKFSLLASLSQSSVKEDASHSVTDVRNASEAVVDAAIICQQLFGEPEVSWQMRESLIEMIIEKPELSESLFEKGSSLFRLC